MGPSALWVRRMGPSALWVRRRRRWLHGNVRRKSSAGRSFYDGSMRDDLLSCALPDRAVRKARPSRKLFSGMVAPSRNLILGRLYPPETLFCEGWTFAKAYSGEVVSSSTLFCEGFTFPHP